MSLSQTKKVSFVVVQLHLSQAGILAATCIANALQVCDHVTHTALQQHILEKESNYS